MMACLVNNRIHILVSFVFLMLYMNATVISSVSEMVPVHSNMTTMNRCIETERHALLGIKRGIEDRDGLLSSWGSPQQEDYCQWSGVGCDNLTGHITHLDLSYVSYYNNDLSYISSYYDYNDVDAYGRLRASNLSRSLLELKNLKYLDHSWIDFGKQPTPKFIGSLSNLVYLGLSHAYLGGAIPHELGNLSMLNHLDLSSSYSDPTLILKSIASITSLTYLDISGNGLTGEIPHELGNLSKLHHLDLGYNIGLKGGNFDWLFHLSSLTHLDLSNMNTGSASNWLRFIQRLPSLSFLHLNDCDLKGTPSSFSSNSSSSISTLHLSGNQLPYSIFNWLYNLSGSLVDLDLSLNHLKGNIPESLAYMTSIKSLELSSNELDGVHPTDSFGNLSRGLQFMDLSVNNLSGNLQDILYVLPEDSLQVLLISDNKFTGSLPDITRFSSLRKLHAGQNQLNGYLPEVFKHKSVLQSLHLSSNFLRGSLPSFTGFLHLKELALGGNYFSGSLPGFMGLQSLRYLYLYYNEFSGNVPDFTGLQSLKKLHLDNNKFSGSIPDFTGCSSLKVLRLEENEITEWKTQSTGQLTNLRILDLSVNSIASTISESQLCNLSRLEHMDASLNSLTFNISSGWLPPFQIGELYLGSCKLGPKFPNWIQNQTNIYNLDFSNSQISDTIPMWFWNLSSIMQRLDLSYNKIRGQFSWKHFDVFELDISYNNFEGQLPLISSLSSKINLSNNKFSGELVYLSPVKDMGLDFLDCSHNLLSGVLPNKWVYFPKLAYLNLGYNNFSGTIPFSIRYLISLQTLILRHNSFYGGFPYSLRNCSSLGFLDFRFNKLSGKIPEWIGEDLPQLYALILKSNKFHGSIPSHLCHLSKLHFLDLSINRISGTLPGCFSDFNAMIQNGTQGADHNYKITWYYVTPNYTYVDNALASWKGNEFVYGRNFAYLKMIDISSNILTGEIPIGITRLVNLNGLNLSRNKFSGEIPEEIGRMEMLENLDFSRNKFSGEIPQSMSKLHFLSYLDLSNNNLSGKIPTGTQLQGFSVSAYEGNVKLCGPPLKKICPGDEQDTEIQPSSDGNEADEDEVEYKRWLYISTALGFGTTFWGICGVLVLNRRWRHAYFLFLNNLKDRLYVIMAVRIARLRS